MKYYLSSYRIGNAGEKLKELIGVGIIASIPNALDYVPVHDQARTRQRNADDLVAAGIRSELLDLKDYFGSPDRLRSELNRFAGCWVTGGNTFVLRQAMHLSGFDQILRERISTDFVYGGYSAGICVLAPNLDGIKNVDDPTQLPYSEMRNPIYEGLKLLDYIFLPHFRSEHPESEAIEKDFERCKAERIPFRTIKDGDALYGQNIESIRRHVEIVP